MDHAALAASRTSGLDTLPKAARLEAVILAWLDHLAPHRKVARQMIGAKAEFGHVHIQIPALMRISRTVQWFLEAARVDSTGLQRILDESCVSTIYLATFARWLFDESPGSRSSRDFLGRALARWNRGCCRKRASRTGPRQEERGQPTA